MNRLPPVLFALATALAITLALGNIHNAPLLIAFSLMACVLAILCFLSFHRGRN